MKNNIPCSMVKDLAPLYAEDLISKETKEVIEEHLQECKDCKKQYDIYTEESERTQSIDRQIEEEEIDYMKRLHAYQRSNRNLGAIISFLFGCSIPVLRVGIPIMLGSGISEYHLARLQVTWQIGLLKMFITGEIALCGYLMINNYLRNKKLY